MEPRRVGALSPHPHHEAGECVAASVRLGSADVFSFVERLLFPNIEECVYQTSAYCPTVSWCRFYNSGVTSLTEPLDCRISFPALSVFFIGCLIPPNIY